MRKPLVYFSQMLFLLLLLFVALLPGAVFADDPSPTVSVQTGSWDPNPANVGDVISSDASASDSNAPQPAKEHTITAHWTWTTAGVYVSGTGDAGTFAPYTGNYVIEWNNGGDDTSSSIKFNGIFNDPGYYIVKINVSVRYHDETSDTDVQTSTGTGYLAGSASDIQGTPGNATKLQAHQAASGGDNTHGIPVKNGMYWDPGDPMTFTYTPGRLDTDSSGNTTNTSIGIKVKPGDTVTMGVDVADKDRIKPIGASNDAYVSVDGPTPHVVELRITSGYPTIASFDGGQPYVRANDHCNNKNLTFKDVTASRWQDVAVTATITDNGTIPPGDKGDCKDPQLTHMWTFVKSDKDCPISLQQSPSGGAFQDAPATYVYTAGNQPPPYYQDMAIDESFGKVTAGFSMSDVTPAWQQLHATLNTPDKIADYIFGSGGGTTSSFVINASNQFPDQHGGGGLPDGISFTPSQPCPFIASGSFGNSPLARGISWNLPQTYTCGEMPIQSGGSHVITRKFTGTIDGTETNGTYHQTSLQVSKS